MPEQVYIGLMSGTSLDGVDAVAVGWRDDPPAMRLLGHHHLPFSAELRKTLLALNSSGPDELHRAALAGNAVAGGYARAVEELLGQCRLERSAVRALGAHGQTVRHRPGEFDGTGYTSQLLNPALLAERVGIDVVCDFRTRDVAAGGQGAPLVPAFHHAVFGGDGIPRAILNIGGMANLTLLGGQDRILGFDCGPGNVLMDLWCERHLGKPYDQDGVWASTGQVDTHLLAAMMNDAFIRKTPPKSTGRDHFHAAWLDTLLQHDAVDGTPAAVDVQATLAEFTAASALAAALAAQPDVHQLLVCGGGALNGHLMHRLTTLAKNIAVASTATAGLDPMQVEATAFAWMAMAFVQRRPANVPEVTGAAGARLLGALYPA